MCKLKVEVRSLSEIDELCGTKATTLFELLNLGLPVPDFWSVPSSCFEHFCQEKKIPSIEHFYASNKFNLEVNEKFMDADVLNGETIVKKLISGKYMVRSSAIPNNIVDLEMFPSMISGAFESYFAPSVSEVKKNILNVWKSVFLEKAYKQCRMFSDLPIINGIGVLIQRYIEPVISGVIHTKEKNISINWIEGHLSKIVNGEAIGNSIEAYISSEQNYILRGIESNILLIKEKNYEEVFKSLLNITTIIKKYFGHDQEIEWIYDGKQVWIVQSQPLIS